MTTLSAWSAGLRAAQAAPEDLDEALAADRALLRARLREIALRPTVREALFLASPSLEESLPIWISDPDSERGLKVERTLVRYVQRMAGRATPFGLFAGSATGCISDSRDAGGAKTRLELLPLSAAQRHTRLDMDYLYALVESLTRDPALARALPVVPNSSLYRAAGRLRYVETRLATDDARTRSYHLVAAEPDVALELLLARSRGGATLHELGAALQAEHPDASDEEAAGFVSELIDAQLLVPQLAPTVTGPEPLPGLIAELGEHALANGVRPAEPLRTAAAALSAIDASGLGVDTARYREIAERLVELPVRPELARLFQVDLVRPAKSARLGKAVTRELFHAIAALQRITPRRDPLAAFRDAFVARYEQREVPLAEALDEEAGIGTVLAPAAEAAPLLAGLAFPSPPTRPSLGAAHPHLFARLCEVVRSGSDELVLDEADLRALGEPTPMPLPESFAVLATLSADSEAAIDSGSFRVVIEGVSGPSGAEILGRFCHADPALSHAVSELLRAEAAHQPDAIYAEIVHLPAGRVGNILLRPLLRTHELVYLGRSGAPLARCIGIDELRVSVRGSRVVLRSAKLDRVVLPRLSTAHAVGAQHLGIYQFLSLVHQQDGAALSFRWRGLESAPYLPRVTYGRAVLARARWRLGRRELATLADARASRSATFAAMQTLRATHKLPRYLALSDDDNLLPVDLDNALSVEALAQLLRSREVAVLTEQDPQDKLCTHGPEGRYLHQLVVPFLRPVAKAPANSRIFSSVSIKQDHVVPRMFAPGSEWLYARLYAGPTSCDRLLRRLVAPLVAQAKESAVIDDWFFLRYGDPDWHLRLRLHGDPERLLSEVLPALHAAAAPFLSSGELRKLELGSYEPEVERYGGAVGLRLSEELFAVDSAAVLELIAQSEGDAGEAARWRLALFGMDALLGDLGFGLAARRAITATERGALAREFFVDAGFEKQLGERYRKHSNELHALLRSGAASDPLITSGVAILRKRSLALAPICEELRRAESDGSLTQSLGELAGSYLHLHVNRSLRGAQRAQELVLYDLLARVYASFAAREKTVSR